MELWEAVKLLKEGKKVRKKTWARKEYIRLNLAGVLVDENNETLINVGDVFFGGVPTLWEEYKEGWQNIEVKNIWDLPEGVVDMAQVTAANCPYCNKKVVTLRILGDCKYCPYCGKQVIK